eukprot:scaffold26148_cov185-Isochrysis_galbana.AAC.1
MLKVEGGRGLFPSAVRGDFQPHKHAPPGLGRCRQVLCYMGQETCECTPSQRMVATLSLCGSGHPTARAKPTQESTCVAHLYMIAWRFIITDFYQLNYNKELPPFDEAQAYSMAKAFTIRAIIHARERSGATHPWVAPVSCAGYSPLTLTTH